MRGRGCVRGQPTGSARRGVGDAGRTHLRLGHAAAGDVMLEEPDAALARHDGDDVVRQPDERLERTDRRARVHLAQRLQRRPLLAAGAHRVHAQVLEDGRAGEGGEEAAGFREREVLEVDVRLALDVDLRRRRLPRRRRERLRDLDLQRKGSGARRERRAGVAGCGAGGAAEAAAAPGSSCPPRGSRRWGPTRRSSPRP